MMPGHFEPFAQLGLSDSLEESITKSGFLRPTAIQSMAIPPILQERDLVATASSGSGQTLSYVLATLSLINTESEKAQLLVIVPNRQRANKVAHAFIRSRPEVRVANVASGEQLSTQLDQLKEGAHVIVGTASRIREHAQRGLIDLPSLRSVILDQASELVNMGFRDQTDDLLRQLADGTQKLCFTNALTPPVNELIDAHLNDPIYVQVNSEDRRTEIQHKALAVKPQAKLPLLARLLKSESFDGVIIFARRDTAGQLAENLCGREFKAAALPSDVETSARDNVVSSFNDRQLDVLVTTDDEVVGIDLARGSHIVSYDLPDEDHYQRRIQFIERIPTLAQSIVLVNPENKSALEQLEKAIGQTIPVEILPPDEKAAKKPREDRLVDQLQTTIAEQDMDRWKDVVKEVVYSHPWTLEDVAAALACLVSTTRSQQTTHDRQSNQRNRQPERRDGRRRDSRRPSERSRQERSRSPGRPGHRPAMSTYRIEVGHAHGVRPGNIVGAITNAAGLRGSEIGGIDIQADFSTVELPTGMSSEQLQQLQELHVAGQPLRISRWRPTGNRSHVPSPQKQRRRPSWKKPRNRNSG